MAYRAVFDEQRGFGIELEGFGLFRTEVETALNDKRIPAVVADRFDKKIPKWAITQDGTIKQTTPLEIVSPILKGRSGLAQVRKVCDVINELGIEVDSSCGFHVHWSTADFVGRDMVNLLRLYGKFEKVLDFLFHPSRRGDQNEFAHSLIRDELYFPSPHFHAYQVAQEFAVTEPTKNTTSYPTARHHKINICAYNKYSTVEFRQHEGTFDFEKIKNWIVFSQQLIRRGKDTWVTEGVATWDSLIKTLALTESQLRESMDSPDKIYLREARDFYRKIYREEREKENAVLTRA